ncbi:E1-E2 ATPase-domain-containing protein [Aspergillus avenaceus]|uniref:E1-E2 ATPase-domain-containing protein n=1 Tax=Aspergillus avenaceus TaxID=36643 RepID=A0A5N6TTT2_ASPAV|nr:E1-E2 ATPase-domain-containing protein [Aspergillus avenaceus]
MDFNNSNPPTRAPEPDANADPTKETNSCLDSCNPQPLYTMNTDEPSCCRGKARPCCDTSCLDRLALRECEMSPLLHTCGGAVDHKACSQHTLSALDRYSATLQILGCICRSLIALGQKTCCETRERHSLDRERCSRMSSARPLRTSLDFRASNGSLMKDRAVQSHPRLRRGLGESARSVEKPLVDSDVVSSCSTNKPVGRRLPKSCCSGCQPVKEPPKSNTDDSCCSQDKINGVPTKTKCHLSETPRIEKSPPQLYPGSCCPGDQPVQDNNTNIILADSCRSKVDPAAEPQTGRTESWCGLLEQDILTSKTSFAHGCGTERHPISPRESCIDACCSAAASPGLEIEKVSRHAITDMESQGTGKEHVVLSISGMTCTGCETKLNRVLATVHAVKNLRTSLVLSRAEFDIDLRLGSVEEIIKLLERTTEFKCGRVQNQGSSLDLIVHDEPAKLIGQIWPDGVLDMAFVDKQTVRVTFDPKIVGARDLTEKAWGRLVRLASPRGDPLLEAGSKHVRHVGYMTLLSAVLTIPVLVMAWAPLPQREVAYASASLTLATIVQIVIALDFSRVIEMDLLIVLSTSAAYIFSLVFFGYLNAEKPLSTAVESLSIRSLQASTAILVDAETGAECEIDVRLFQYGDIFKILPDSRIPTDGTVITGSSEVDESMLTGESRPVEKYPKSAIIAGSINGPGILTARLNRLPGDNTIHTIAAMVDEAKLSKPKLQDLADRVASYFVPVVVALTIITFVTWVAVGVATRGLDGSEAIIQAITYAITVLIVSCPCAIGLAVPVVVVIVSGVAAEKGIIFKSADAIEVAHKKSHVVFDKTGTLTRGKLSVDSLPFLLGLIETSQHPVSVSVAVHLKEAGVVASTVTEPKSLTGKGVEATVSGRRLQAGNSRWLNLSDNEHVQRMLAQGHTVFCSTIDNTLHAIYSLEGELRPDAIETINTLQKHNISVHIVSGDDDIPVHTLASKLSVPTSNIRSRSSPIDKRNYIQTLQEPTTGTKNPVIIFCGDGTNDTVALAQATIGIHINEGTDIAQSAADIVLMRPSLAAICTIITASRVSVTRIKLNFLWRFVYNTFAVLLAAGVFVNFRIPPEVAGLGELVSVLPVIVAGAMLRWSKI